MKKTFFKLVGILFISLVSLSCSLITDNYGNIDFYLPEIEQNSRNAITLKSVNSHKFVVTLETTNGRLIRKEILPPKARVVLDNVPLGTYLLSLKYEDNVIILKGSKLVTVKRGVNNPIDITVSYTIKKPIVDDNINKPETQPENNNGNEGNAQPSLPDNEKPDTQLPEVKPEDSNTEGNNQNTPETDNGGTTQPPFEGNGNEGDTQPSIPNPEDKPDSGNGEITPPTEGEFPESKPDENQPMEYVTYYVDGINGNDLNDGLSFDKPFKTVSKASSCIQLDGDYLIEVRGTVTENRLIEFAKNANVKIKGTNNKESKIIRSSGSDLMVVGTSNGKDKNNNLISVCPTVTLENITIQANTTERGILVYYGSLHLGEGVIVQGASKVGVQGHVGTGSQLYVGGNASIVKKINLHGNGFITVEKTITSKSPITLNLLKNDGKTPNYATANHQVVKAINDVILENEVSNFKLGNKNFVLSANGTVTKKK